MMISTQDIYYSISETGIFPDDYKNDINPAYEPKEIPVEMLSIGMINRNRLFYQKISLPNLLFYRFSILLEFLGQKAFAQEITIKLEYPKQLILKFIERLQGLYKFKSIVGKTMATYINLYSYRCLKYKPFTS